MSHETECMRARGGTGMDSRSRHVWLNVRASMMGPGECMIMIHVTECTSEHGGSVWARAQGGGSGLL